MPMHRDFQIRVAEGRRYIQAWSDHGDVNEVPDAFLQERRARRRRCGDRHALQCLRPLLGGDDDFAVHGG